MSNRKEAPAGAESNLPRRDEGGDPATLATSLHIRRNLGPTGLPSRRARRCLASACSVMPLDQASATALEGVLRNKRGARVLTEHPPGGPDMMLLCVEARCTRAGECVVRMSGTCTDVVCPVLSHPRSPLGVRLLCSFVCALCPPPCPVSVLWARRRVRRMCVRGSPCNILDNVSESLTITDLIYGSRLRECGAGQRKV